MVNKNLDLKTEEALSIEDKNLDLKTEKGLLSKGDLNAKKLNIGWLGRLFGSTRYAPFNIVGLTIILGFLLISIIGAITITYTLRDNQREVLQNLLLFLTNIVTLAFGYLFGKGKGFYDSEDM